MIESEINMLDDRMAMIPSDEDSNDYHVKDDDTNNITHNIDIDNTTTVENDESKQVENNTRVENDYYYDHNNEQNNAHFDNPTSNYDDDVPSDEDNEVCHNNTTASTSPSTIIINNKINKNNIIDNEDVTTTTSITVDNIIDTTTTIDNDEYKYDTENDPNNNLPSNPNLNTLFSTNINNNSVTTPSKSFSTELITSPSRFTFDSDRISIEELPNLQRKMLRKRTTFLRRIREIQQRMDLWMNTFGKEMLLMDHNNEDEEIKEENKDGEESSTIMNEDSNTNTTHNTKIITTTQGSITRKIKTNAKDLIYDPLENVTERVCQRLDDRINQLVNGDSNIHPSSNDQNKDDHTVTLFDEDGNKNGDCSNEKMDELQLESSSSSAIATATASSTAITIINNSNNNHNTTNLSKLNHQINTIIQPQLYQHIRETVPQHLNQVLKPIREALDDNHASLSLTNETNQSNKAYRKMIEANDEMVGLVAKSFIEEKVQRKTDLEMLKMQIEKIVNNDEKEEDAIMKYKIVKEKEDEKLERVEEEEEDDQIISEMANMEIISVIEKATLATSTTSTPSKKENDSMMDDNKIAMMDINDDNVKIKTIATITNTETTNDETEIEAVTERAQPQQLYEYDNRIEQFLSAIREVRNQLNIERQERTEYDAIILNQIVHSREALQKVLLGTLDEMMP